MNLSFSSLLKYTSHVNTKYALSPDKLAHFTSKWRITMHLSEKHEKFENTIKLSVMSMIDSSAWNSINFRISEIYDLRYKRDRGFGEVQQCAFSLTLNLLHL